MWVNNTKDFEMINLENIDSIEINLCEEDNQFELDFLKNEKIINYIFFNNEEELKRAYESIVSGLRNNIKVLNI